MSVPAVGQPGSVNALLGLALGRGAGAALRPARATPPLDPAAAPDRARPDRQPTPREPDRYEPSRAVRDPLSDPGSFRDLAKPRKPDGTPLTDDEQRELRELQKRDAEVRAHEQAHAAAAGGLAKGGPSFETQRGPDGKDYAVGGEVSLDSSPVEGDPEATIRKMQQVRSAALAPADPSPQDRKVAAQASQAEAKARQELREQRAGENGAEPSAEPSAEQGGNAGEASPTDRFEPTGALDAARAAAADEPEDGAPPATPSLSAAYGPNARATLESARTLDVVA